jgi:hypothetical protein
VWLAWPPARRRISPAGPSAITNSIASSRSAPIVIGSSYRVHYSLLLTNRTTAGDRERARQLAREAITQALALDISDRAVPDAIRQLVNNAPGAATPTAIEEPTSR